MSLNGNLNKSQFMEELQQKVEHINDVLEKFLPAEEGQQRIIFEAMNYSVRAGGKRLRPILMEETYHMFGGSSAVIEPFMAAIEMIHTYSLVHDDLPAMDMMSTGVERRPHMLCTVRLWAFLQVMHF